MTTTEQELILKSGSNSVVIGKELKIYKITRSKVIFETQNHSITKFQTITNKSNCEITVNCGATPPRIDFRFDSHFEDMEIDHNYQTKVINTLKKFEKLVNKSFTTSF